MTSKVKASPTRTVMTLMLCLACMMALHGCSFAPSPEVDSQPPSQQAPSAAEEPGARESTTPGKPRDGVEEAPDAEAVDKGAPSGCPSTPDSAEPDAPATYPTGWLAIPADGVPAGVPVQLRLLPDLDVSAHRSGEPVSEQEQSQLDGELPAAEWGYAVVEYDGACHVVDVSVLLVNLPDVLPEACYDEVYAYAATSNCAGMEIPGITGQRLEGYVDGKQVDAYLNREEFVVPCAYQTMLKARAACGTLAGQGYRLLVFDAYRPMTAQWQLSDAFSRAYVENPDIAAVLGEWSMGWYVAQGASGHNYGTDLDVGVCDMEGNPLPMPSSFDAFDASGHLAFAPIDSASITPDAFCDAVAGNDACMALHAAFRQAGFSELASEWWHFGDAETEGAMRAAVGEDGLDFVASL